MYYIKFLEFTIDNFCELLSYIATDNLNIRIHRDITGEMWANPNSDLKGDTYNVDGLTNSLRTQQLRQFAHLNKVK